MKILVILNNHNSLTIMNLCFLLKKKFKEIDYFAVTDSTFFNTYKDKLSKYDSPKIIFKKDNKKLKINNLSKINHRNNWLSTFLKNIILNISDIVKSSSFYLMIREFVITKKMNFYKNKALNLLQKTEPNIVLSISDRTYDYVESPILWAAKKTGIPNVLTYSNQFDINSALSFRKDPLGQILPLCSSPGP